MAKQQHKSWAPAHLLFFGTLLFLFGATLASPLSKGEMPFVGEFYMYVLYIRIGAAMIFLGLIFQGVLLLSRAKAPAVDPAAVPTPAPRKRVRTPAAPPAP